MSFKFTHITDIHLGSYKGKVEAGGINSRLLDFMKTFYESIDFTISNKCDLCLITGDIFRHKDPQPVEFDAFSEGIQRLIDNDIKTVIVLGNHDLFQSQKLKNSISALKTLKLKNVIISEIPEIITLNLKNEIINIQTMPYQIRNILGFDDNESVSMYMESKINEMYESLDKNMINIFAGHFSIKDSISGSEQLTINRFKEPIVSKEIFLNKKYIYVAMGHLHKYQKVLSVPPVVYGGSINRIDFNEWKEDKGFVFCQYDKEKFIYEFIKVEAKKFIFLEYNLEDEEFPEDIILKDLANKKEQLMDSVIKFKITLSEKNKNNYSASKIIEFLSGVYYDIHDSTSPIIVKGNNKTDIQYDEFMAPMENLKKYCESNDRIIDKEEFLRLCEDIIKKSNIGVEKTN